MSKAEAGSISKAEGQRVEQHQLGRSGGAGQGRTGCSVSQAVTGQGVPLSLTLPHKMTHMLPGPHTPRGAATTQTGQKHQGGKHARPSMDHRCAGGATHLLAEAG